MSSHPAKKLWAIIPAAGIGSRMQADIPKQYLELAGQPVLQHTLTRLHASLDFAQMIVALNPNDPYWPIRIDTAAMPVRTVDGGKERSDSVLSGLQAMAGQAQADDWVLVHDAARPCVRSSDLHKLLAELEACAHGGLLAAPVKDTMKRSDAQGWVQATVARENLWHALTPQVFAYGELLAAYRAAQQAGEPITDEAMAIERAGGQVKLVAGSQDNIKITRPEDLALAELYLAAQQAESQPESQTKSDAAVYADSPKRERIC